MGQLVLDANLASHGRKHCIQVHTSLFWFLDQFTCL